MFDKISQRSPSQPSEGGRGRHLYNLDNSKKRSKSAPPEVSLPAHIRASLAYEDYYTRIMGTSKSPKEREKLLEQLDEFYNQMKNNKRGLSYEEQWKPFRLLEMSITNAEDKVNASYEKMSEDLSRLGISTG